jgi:hypothetical protein
MPLVPLAPAKKSGSFDAGTRLELVLQGDSVGAGLDTDHVDDSLAQTFPSMCTDSEVHTAGILSRADTSSWVDPVTSIPAVPLMHARERVRGEHMANGGRLLVSHWITSRLWPQLILLNLILHQFTLPHQGLGALDLLLPRFWLHLCAFVPKPVCSRGIRKPKIYTNGTDRYVLFTASGEPHNHQEALCDSRWGNRLWILSMVLS